MRTDGVVLATVAMLWCSATQKRLSPSRSANCAMLVALANASALVSPSDTNASSSADNGTRGMVNREVTAPSYHRTPDELQPAGLGDRAEERLRAVLGRVAEDL